MSEVRNSGELALDTPVGRVYYPGEARAGMSWKAWCELAQANKGCVPVEFAGFSSSQADEDGARRYSMKVLEAGARARAQFIPLNEWPRLVCSECRQERPAARRCPQHPKTIAILWSEPLVEEPPASASQGADAFINSPAFRTGFEQGQQHVGHQVKRALSPQDPGRWPSTDAAVTAVAELRTELEQTRVRGTVHEAALREILSVGGVHGGAWCAAVAMHALTGKLTWECKVCHLERQDAMPCPEHPQTRVRGTVRLRTWHMEALVVASALAGALVAFGKASDWREWVAALGVQLGFHHASVASRLQEAEEDRPLRDTADRAANTQRVECVAWLQRYWVGKELAWVLYFLSTGAVSPLVGCAVFLAHPFWRRWYRSRYPKKEVRA